MTLPCVFYNVNDGDFESITEVFQQVFNVDNLRFQVSIRSNDPIYMQQAIERLEGIYLFIVYVSTMNGADGNDELDRVSLRIGKQAALKNRDNYVIYLAQDNRVMLRMAPTCVRPAGLLTVGMFKDRGNKLMREISKDFRLLNGNEVFDNQKWLFLKLVGGSVLRINQDQIFAVLASNKDLEFHTSMGVYAVHGTLDSYEGLLDSRFCRCHRSCLINNERIQYVDFMEMTITMADGLKVPLARSFKQAMDKLIYEQENKSVLNA